MTKTLAKRASPLFDSLEQEAFLNLWRCYDRLRAEEDALFGQHDLTPQQYNALRLLSRAHPRAVPTLKLAEKLVSRAPDITRMLDKLAARGLVERERLADNRRVVQVSITSQGLALLKRLDEPVRQCHQRQLGHMSHEKLRTLIALLRAASTPHEDPVNPWGT